MSVDMHQAQNLRVVMMHLTRIDDGHSSRTSICTPQLSTDTPLLPLSYLLVLLFTSLTYRSLCRQFKDNLHDIGLAGKYDCPLDQYFFESAQDRRQYNHRIEAMVLPFEASSP